MTNHNTDPEPSNLALPTISLDTMRSLSTEVARDDYLTETLDMMLEENPNLALALNEIVTLEDSKTAKAQFFAASIVYRAFRAQAEADRMESTFEFESTES